MPYLVFPTTAVRESYLAGERAVSSLEAGADLGWLSRAAADFDAFVARRRSLTERWDVPVTELWYVEGSGYLGSLVVRHRLTPSLARVGGNIGYHVVPAARRQGHATRMLAEALVYCVHFGLDPVLVTCDAGNGPSRKVIEANAGVLEGSANGELRFLIHLDRRPA
jgi:predicted acetyltransferase